MVRSREFDALSAAQIAAGRTAPRSVTTDAQFRPPAPRPMAELLDTIEHVAEAATGERSFLHLTGHRATAARDGTHADGPQAGKAFASRA